MQRNMQGRVAPAAIMCVTCHESESLLCCSLRGCGCQGQGNVSLRCGVHTSQGDIVVELTWVDGHGNIRRDSRDSEAGRALVGGLGVAGLVTELLLQLELPSLTAVDTRFKQHDGKLYEDVVEMLKVHSGRGLQCLGCMGCCSSTSFMGFTHAS